MWLIIPKNDDQDILEWGLSNNLNSQAAIRQESGNYKRIHVACGPAGFEWLAKTKEKCDVWVLNQNSRFFERNPAPIPEELAAAVDKVLVHFGGVNKIDMNKQWIAESWTKKIQEFHLPDVLSKISVLPISKGSDLPWSQSLNNFQAQFTSAESFTLEQLENAWNTAWAYFYGESTVTKEVVEGLFGFYVDVREFLTIPDDEISEAIPDLVGALNGLLHANQASAQEFNGLFGEARKFSALDQEKRLVGMAYLRGLLRDFVQRYEAMAKKYTQSTVSRTQF